MEKIIKVLNEHHRIKDEMEEFSNSAQKTGFDIQRILISHGRTFLNFEPVFSSDRISASLAAKRILLSYNEKFSLKSNVFLLGYSNKDK